LGEELSEPLDDVLLIGAMIDAASFGGRASMRRHDSLLV
jgi:hypothetical protein